MPVILEDIAMAVERARAMGDEVLLIDPETADELFRMNEFIDASEYGSGTRIREGEIGRIFGMPVVITRMVERIQSSKKKIDMNRRLGDV